MINFILNTLFTKKVVEQKPLKNTYVRKGVDVVNTSTRKKFVLTQKRENKTELSIFFEGLKGLNVRERKDYLEPNDKLIVR